MAVRLVLNLASPGGGRVDEAGCVLGAEGLHAQEAVHLVSLAVVHAMRFVGSGWM